VLGDVAGKDALELGCGTGYFSAWLARIGTRPTAIDVTPAQLETARRMQAEHGITFPLIEANAEEVPLPDASFDLILSEYGASIWCDPYRWIPEALRLLRPGGDLVFLVNGTLLVLTAPDEDEVLRASSSCAITSTCTGLNGRTRTRRWSSTSATAIGSGSCVQIALKSSTSLSCAPQRMRRRQTATSLLHRSGRAVGRLRRSGRHASEDDALAGTARGALLCRRNAICQGDLAREKD
jgi:SAM-dependent methyltransferase